MMKNCIDHSFKELAHHLSEAVVLTDSKGRITWTNGAFHQLCGYSPEEIIGRKPGDFLQGELTDITTARALHDAVKEGEPIQVEILNYHKNGFPYWASVSITPIKDETGKLDGFLAIEQNTTKQQQQLLSMQQQVVEIYHALLTSEGHDATMYEMAS